MATNMYNADIDQESASLLATESVEDFQHPLVDDLEGPALRLQANRWPRIAFALASSLAVAAAVALLLHGAPAPDSIVPSSAVELAATYTDLGRGKCTLQNGADPKNDWKGSGDIKAMCDSRSDCLAYSRSSAGGGLMWLSGPLKGGGGSWGGCHCNVKQGAAPSAIGSAPDVPRPTVPAPVPGPPLPKDANQGDAKPFANVHLATLGYNLYYGDPLPIFPSGSTPTATNTVMDPGLRKPLFEIEYTPERLTSDRRHTVPDGYGATVDEGCSTVFTTKKIRDEYEYKTDQSQKVSAYARAELAVKFPAPGKGSKTMKGVTVGVSGKLFARAGGTLSYQWRDIQNQKRLRDQQMWKTEAKCNAYVASFSYVDPPKTHPDFQKAVDGLGNDARKHYTLFDEYGTHFLTTVRFGARYGTNIFISNKNSDNLRKKADGIGLTVEASVGAVAKLGVSYKKADLGIKKVVKYEKKFPLITPKEKTVGQEISKSMVSSKTISVVGPPLPQEGAEYWLDEVRKAPVPTMFDSEPICQHPAIVEDTVKYTRCVGHMETYCDRHLRAKGASCSTAAERECYNDLECNENFACRGFSCVAVPVCKVTVYKNAHFEGGSMQLKEITDLKHFGGEVIALDNGNFRDSISSIKLTDGCLKVELVDDDNRCSLGKGDNGIYRESARSLPDDLDNDVCKVKIWAKPVPGPQPEVGVAGWIVLKGKRTSQSSKSDHDRAVDGDRSADFGQASCTHTGNDRQAWWKVDLGQTYDVKSVKVTNRKDCCSDRLNPFMIWVGSSKCASWQRLAAGETKEIPCVATGSSVKIQLHNSNPLTLCEVEVKAMKKGRRLTLSNGEAIEVEDEDAPFLNESSSAVAATPAAYVDPWMEPGNVLQHIKPAPEMPLLANASKRRLAASGQYLKNIGKAMYGYNTYYGAPFSTEFAGTDPGFRHRPLWAVKYSQGRTATSKYFSKVPKDEANRGAAEAISAGYKEFPSNYLSGYSSFGGKVLGLMAAKVQCQKVSDCTGITCNKDGCTLRKGNELKSSPNRESTYVREAKAAGIKGNPCSALLYPGNYFDGPAWYFAPGDYSMHAFTQVANNDDVSSIEVKGKTGCKLTLYQHGSFGGWQATLGPGRYTRSDMTRKGVRDNDISSMKLHDWTRRLQELSDPEAAEPSEEEPKADEDNAVHGLPRRLTEALKVPDGWKVTRASRAVCDKTFNTKEIKSEYAYQAEVTKNLNPFGFKLDLGKVTLSMSHESREFQKSNAKTRKTMFVTGAECLDYIAELDESSPPETSPNFKSVADQVSKEDEWYRLFDMFGVHYPTKMYFGAKYGLTTYMSRGSYATVTEKSSAFSVGAEVTKKIEIDYKKMSKVKASATVGASYGEKSSQGISKEYEEVFQEEKEYSLGKRLPADGGVEDWIKDLDSEPMPTRYGLKSICNHPALAPKKADCEKYADSYCPNHLVKSQPRVSCEAPQEVECLWDLDCLPYHKCTEANTCVQTPYCIVEIFSAPNLGGSRREYGPVYYEENPEGKVMSVGGDIDSVRVSGGCADVILMDQDECSENYEDNGVIANRDTNRAKQNNNLNYDLEDDVCKIKVHAKSDWVH
jgi:hypothetical protein